MFFGSLLIFLGALLHLVAAISVGAGRDQDATWHVWSRSAGWALIAIGGGALTIRAA